ncbi:MAG: type II secretion system GspH family protein [Oscillospiraceae bacterium]|jgi:prepilin-type N-terminal cleavage/methylation domain-containing protein|nr:type II secretion system GspH family protein [Oscillospiraceae bacterium]
MKNKRGNGGFTLIELLVSFVILGVVSTGLVALMTAGSRTFRNVSNTSDVQYECQVVLSQVAEHIINCNGGIAVVGTLSNGIYRGGTLYVVDRDGTTTAFTRSGSNNFMLNGDVLSEIVTTFTAELTAPLDDCAEVTVTMTFTKGNRTYTGTQIISQRNKLVYENDITRLRTKLGNLYPP